MIYVNLERGDSGDPATVDEAVGFLPQTLRLTTKMVVKKFPYVIFAELPKRTPV